MSNYATEQMLHYVETTRQRAKRAEREFDSANSMIQRKASRSIGLFDGDAPARVVEIASDARRACDDLYSAYQSAIQSLDDRCRPLLSEQPEARAVREVRDLIKWLNDESEIENNFTASLDSYSLGGIASAKYVPMMQCRMIQRYWEDKYENMPERLEEQRLQRERAEQQRRQADERAQREFDEAMVEYNRKLAEYERALPAHQREMQRYESEYGAWRAEMDAIERGRSMRVRNRMETEKRNARKNIETRHNAEQGRLLNERRDVQMRLDTAQVRLAGTGLLRIAERNELKNQIMHLTREEARLNQEIQNGSNKLADMLLKEARRIEGMEQTYRKEDERRYPNPPEPRKPTGPVKPTMPVKKTARPTASSSSYGSSFADRPTATQVVQEAMMQDILDGMEPGRLYTITELIMEIPSLADMTNQRTSALVRQLVSRGDLERVEEMRKAYFRLA